MDRLTYYNERYKKWCLPQGKGVWRKIVDTVKAYEDTGLTPEEVIVLKEKCRLLEQATKGDDLQNQPPQS